MKNLKVATVDTSHESIIVVKLKPMDIQESDVKEYLDVLFEILKLRTGKCIVIFDGSDSKYMSSEARIFIGKYLKENKSVYSSKVVDTATVTGSVMGKVVLKALMLLIDKDIRTTVFSKSKDAMDWAVSKVTIKVAA